MKKEALLKVILNNIKEVETLVQSFEGPDSINPAFIKLTLQKIETLQQEVELLNSVNDNTSSNTRVEKPNHNNDTIKKDIDTPTETIPVNHTTITEPIIEEKKEEILTLEPENKPEPQKKDVIAREDTPTEESHFEKEVNKDSAPAEAKQNSTIGESISREIPSVADKIGTTKDSSNILLIGKPVGDINKAIGLNDRFLFQRELFNNSNSAMSQTINQLNELRNYDEAISFLKSNYNWDFEDNTVDSFLKTVQRKFI